MQMVTVISEREAAQAGSALADMALLNAIVTTLSASDPLHSKITDLFADEASGGADWNRQCERCCLKRDVGSFNV